MKVSVKVPATTANIGPGFDCLGMALPIYNTITIEETVLPGTGVEINVLADNDSIDQLSLDHVPSDENSIVYKAVELLYNSIGQSPSELKINIHSNIPVARGRKGMPKAKSYAKWDIIANRNSLLIYFPMFRHVLHLQNLRNTKHHPNC